MTRTFHLCLDVRHYLKTAKNRELSRMFKNPDGTSLSADEAKDMLMDELAKGHVVIPVGTCTNFDFRGGGCLGHPESEG